MSQDRQAGRQGAPQHPPLYAAARCRLAAHTALLLAPCRVQECASLYPEVLSSGEWRAQQEQQAAADGAAAAAEPAPTAAASSLASVGGGEPRTAVEALDAAHRSTRLPGSATACVLRLDGRTGELDAANLGDSGFLVIRDGQLHFQSPAMQHFFDCPLQVGCVEWEGVLRGTPWDAAVLGRGRLLVNRGTPRPSHELPACGA